MRDQEKKIGLIRDLFELNGFQCPPEAALKLLKFTEILSVWNQKMNLTAHRSLEDIILKDLVDASYFDTYRIMYRIDSHEILDLACGAGFVGITISILHPEASVYFLDASRKRISFVRRVISDLDIANAHVEWGRGEEIRPHLRERFDSVVSRASFDLSTFQEVSRQYVQNSGHTYFMAGSDKRYDVQNGGHDLVEMPAMEYVIKPEGYRRRILIFKKDPLSAGST